MRGLWGVGQMMFTKYIIVVDDDVSVHNPSAVLFCLCANTDSQRDSIFTKGPADVLDHATSEIAIGSKLGIDTTKKLPGEAFNSPCPSNNNSSGSTWPDRSLRFHFPNNNQVHHTISQRKTCQFQERRDHHCRTAPL
jgi:3-polyprenyl-4-hydroxybenzoate decarboxylase